jgi:Tol biopolymer transport system component
MRAIHGAVVLVFVLAAAAAHAASGASTASRFIVFSAVPNGLGPAQLFRVETTGAGLEQITTGSKPASEPAFTANGTQIVFARLGSGIFRVNVDGTGLQRLTSGVRDNYPVMSPNGKLIAFIRVHRSQWRVYVMSAAGGAQRRLPQAPPAGRPSWTANGKSILIPAGGSLAKIDPVTGGVQKYFGVTLDPSTSQTATVAPDAGTLAFVGRRVIKGPPTCGESQCPAFALYLAGVSGAHKRLVANDTGPAGWSPDGKTLVFVSRGALTLQVVAGGARTMIASGPHVAAGDAPPAWQPR